MAFNIPAAVKCPKCDYTGHELRLTTQTSYCPKCFEEFIQQHVPRLVPDPDGKQFDPNSQVVTL